LLSDAQQPNLGSIEFFLSCVGHPHHRLKKVAAADIEGHYAAAKFG
jgi:hypothetical protein